MDSFEEQIRKEKLEQEYAKLTKLRTDKLRVLLANSGEKEVEFKHLLDDPVKFLLFFKKRKWDTLPDTVSKEFDEYIKREGFSYDTLYKFLRYEFDTFGSAGSELGKAYIFLERSAHEQARYVPLMGSSNVSVERFEKVVSKEWQTRSENNTVTDIEGWKDWVISRTMNHYVNRVKYCVQNNIDYMNDLKYNRHVSGLKGEGYFIKPSFNACSWCLYIASRGFQYHNNSERIRNLHGHKNTCKCEVIYSTEDHIKNNKYYKQDVKPITNFFKTHIRDWEDPHAKDGRTSLERQALFEELVANGKFKKVTGISSSSEKP